MFPNDDICDLKAARDAAKRIFQKYKSPKSGLGKLQITNLMKDTYNSLNLDYKPQNEDISSFMSVLDINGDGAISLDDLQNLAVKYLCGEQLQQNSAKQEEQNAQSSNKSTDNQQEIKKQALKQQSSQIQHSIKQYVNKARIKFNQLQNPESEGVDYQFANKLLQYTYQILGKSNYKSSQQEVQLWIKMCDPQKLGRISWQQYQNFITNSIKKAIL